MGGGARSGRSRGGSGGGGGGSRDGRIQATLKTRGYLFPRVFESKSSKDEDKPAPSGPSRPRSEATPTPSPMNGPSGPSAQTATPTPTPAAAKPAAAASTGRPHKITIRVQGHEMVFDLDNRTETMDGQTKTMSDEEYQEAVTKLQGDNWRSEMPPGAEVTVE
jgi:hypothetical protein